MTNHPFTVPCDVCLGQSGGKYAGVGSLTIGPMSIAFCNLCVAHGAEPSFAFDYLYIWVANGDLANLHPAALAMVTWADGRYITLADYVKRWTPDKIAAEHKAYEDTITVETRCTDYRPDHNGECLNCDEPADAHALVDPRHGQPAPGRHGQQPPDHRQDDDEPEQVAEHRVHGDVVLHEPHDHAEDDDDEEDGKQSHE